MYSPRFSIFGRLRRTTRCGNILYYAKNSANVAEGNNRPDEKNNIMKITSTPSDDIPKSEIDPVSGTPFRKLELIPVEKGVDEFVEITRPYDRVIPPAREKRMPVNQDWPSVWPTAHSFKASAVPLPIRMGYQKRLKKPPPSKVGNLELMKIPNFLHLTPPAIKRHCEAIKKFCTSWPVELTADEDGEETRRKYFPIEIVSCDYVHAGLSIRDARSRIVTLQVTLADLPLGDTESRSRQKFIKLVGDRYDPKTDILTIVTDRCPVRHQNRDYAQYLLAVLFHEAWKEEPWEAEITSQDRHKWFWEGSKSQEAVVDIIKHLKQAYDNAQSKVTEGEALESLAKLRKAYPEFIRQVQNENTETILGLDSVKQYAAVWSQYRNRPESVENLSEYGEKVRGLLGLPSRA